MLDVWYPSSGRGTWLGDHQPLHELVAILVTCLRRLKGRRYGEASLSARGGSVGPEDVAIGVCAISLGAVTCATVQGPRRRPLLAPWQVSLAKCLMRQRLASTVAIADIAVNCRLSVSYFERAFANSVGISPYAWLLEQRVARAKDFLRIPAIPIVRIALDCGFTDQAHFTNTFSHKVGMTPRAWRIGIPHRTKRVDDGLSYSGQD